eukprot:614352-Pelagomonas_calceolata.AAC.1
MLDEDVLPAANQSDSRAVGQPLVALNPAHSSLGMRDFCCALCSLFALPAIMFASPIWGTRFMKEGAEMD